MEESKINASTNEAIMSIRWESMDVEYTRNVFS